MSLLSDKELRALAAAQIAAGFIVSRNLGSNLPEYEIRTLAEDAVEVAQAIEEVLVRAQTPS